MSETKSAVPPFVREFFDFAEAVDHHGTVVSTDNVGIEDGDGGDPLRGSLIADLEASTVPDMLSELIDDSGAHIEDVQAFSGRENNTSISLTLVLPKDDRTGDPISTRPVYQAGNSPGITLDRDTLETSGFRLGTKLEIYAGPGWLRFEEAPDESEDQE